MEKVLLYLIAGTRGGETRAKIINERSKKPLNANRLSIALKLDYKTIQHHLKILEENKMLSAIEKGKYGAVYFLSEELEKNMKDFQDIWNKFGNNSGKA